MSVAIGRAGPTGPIIRCACHGGRAHAHQTPLLAAARDADLPQRLCFYTHVGPRQPAALGADPDPTGRPGRADVQTRRATPGATPLYARRPPYPPRPRVASV